jgi:hypothetical protein
MNSYWSQRRKSYYTLASDEILASLTHSPRRHPLTALNSRTCASGSFSFVWSRYNNWFIAKLINIFTDGKERRKRREESLAPI